MNLFTLIRTYNDLKLCKKIYKFIENYLKNNNDKVIFNNFYKIIQNRFDFLPLKVMRQVENISYILKM